MVAVVMLGAATGSLALEALCRASAAPVGAWLQTSPLEACANASVAVVVGLVLLALTGRAAPALTLLAAVLGLFGLVHTTKVTLLGKPLFPWDVFLYREGLALLPRVATGAWAWATLALLGALAIAWRLSPPPLPVKARLGLVALIAVLVLGLGSRPDQRLARLGLVHRRWVQGENYRINGLLLAFVFNLGEAVIRKPAGYGPEAVRAAIASEPAAPPAAREAPQPPTVIVVMSEAFFDPTQLPGVRFSEDPVPNLHRLQREASAGALYAPVFGGGTANTEFEVLTAHSMHFLPSGSIPYQQYVRHQHPSLASIFAARGYRTAAVHTFFRWFWERDQVYRHFGFQRFVSSEDMPGARVDGPYISDAVLTEHLVAEYEADPATPLFLFGVSMEAHGPYAAGRTAEAAPGLEGPLDERARAELSTYASCARHADRELGVLIDYFSRVQRPVYVVFFGDHLPSIPLSLRQTGVVESLETVSPAQKHFLNRVPLIVWSNTGQPRRELGALSASFLGPLLLQLTGTPGTPYTDFVQAVHRQMPIVMRGLVADGTGDLHAEVPAPLEAVDRAWWTLEYDLLFGEGYLSATGSEG